MVYNRVLPPKGNKELMAQMQTPTPALSEKQALSEWAVIAGEEALRKIWDRPEEDLAWRPVIG